MPQEIPIAKFDRKGRVICPVCGDCGEVPPERWLTVGKMVCGNMHAFMITTDVALSVNDILSRSREGNWRKDVIKGHEDVGKGILPEEGGGKVILP